MVTSPEANEITVRATFKKPAVRKRPSEKDKMLCIIQIFEMQHRTMLLLAKGAEVDISSLNDSVRAFLSCLVEMSDGS